MSGFIRFFFLFTFLLEGKMFSPTSDIVVKIRQIGGWFLECVWRVFNLEGSYRQRYLYNQVSGTLSLMTHLKSTHCNSCKFQRDTLLNIKTSFQHSVNFSDYSSHHQWATSKTCVLVLMLFQKCNFVCKLVEKVGGKRCNFVPYWDVQWFRNGTCGCPNFESGCPAFLGSHDAGIIAIVKWSPLTARVKGPALRGPCGGGGGNTPEKLHFWGIGGENASVS